MKDVNKPLRKAYFAALSVTGLQVYENALPNNLNPEEYIIFRGFDTTEASTKNSADTDTNVTVEIHTYKDVHNNSTESENIADDVYRYIYALPQFVLPMDGMQMVSTSLVTDRVQDYGWQNGRMYIDRFITFKHNIFIGGTGGMIYKGIGRYEYTATGGETSFTVTDAIGKSPIVLFKDGVSFLPTTGAITGKQFNFDDATGEVSFAIECEPNELLYLLYE